MVNLSFLSPICSIWTGFIRPIIQGIWCSILFLVVSIFSPSTSPVLQPLNQVINLFSYPCELHRIQTRDGYFLTLFRIPGGKKEKMGSMEKEERSFKSVVLLQHGLLDSSFTWVANGPEKSLCFMLADQGYDVWLGNNRGTVYGRKHIYLDETNEEFWRFSYDEMGKYDLPDSIDYILKVSGQKKLSLVGHSEGTTQTWAALSEMPDLASKLHSVTALGPVASVGHTRNRFIRTLAIYRLDILMDFLLREKSFMCFSLRSYTRIILAIICRLFPSLIDDVVSLLCGKPDRPFDASEVLEWGFNEPGGTSLMNIKHWCQAVRAGQGFVKYDYGSSMNQKFYKQKTPPPYDLNAIPKTLPKLLIYGSVDELVHPTDLAFLVDQIHSPQLIAKEALNYNHTDYLWDPQAATDLYPTVIDFIKSNKR